MAETELYAPVKALLEARGYEVKAEVGPADIVAMRGDEPPVIVELKTGFTLALLHQGVDRLSLSDHVYVAVPEGRGRAWQKAFAANLKLCRRIGLGVITVRAAGQDSASAHVHCDPGPYAARKNTKKAARLLKEFATRTGDPNTGGMTRRTIVTAYRQDAERIAAHLNEQGPQKASDVAKATGITRARTILADNHYGWFERVERGVYGLTAAGQDRLTIPSPSPAA